MTHKHCVFCGEELPIPRPTSFIDICGSPMNTTVPDTAGNRHHAYFMGRSATHPIPADESSSQTDRKYSAQELYQAYLVGREDDCLPESMSETMFIAQFTGGK